MTYLLKDPEAALDYAVDWGAEYLTGDLVEQSSWSASPVEPSGLTIAATACDGRLASVTAAGGVAGHIYRLSNHVVLQSGLTDSRSITVRLEKR